MSDRVVIERHVVLPPIDPLIESFRAEGYEVDLILVDEQRSGDSGLIITPEFIVEITLHVTEAALLGAAAWSARAARRWWKRHHRKMSFPPPVKLARILGPRGEVLRVVEIPDDHEEDKAGRGLRLRR